MTSTISSLALIITAIWMLTTDPLGRFAHPSPPRTHVVTLRKLPAKAGTTDAIAMRMALNEAAAIIKWGK